MVKDTHKRIKEDKRETKWERTNIEFFTVKFIQFTFRWCIFLESLESTLFHDRTVLTKVTIFNVITVSVSTFHDRMPMLHLLTLWRNYCQVDLLMLVWESFCMTNVNSLIFFFRGSDGQSSWHFIRIRRKCLISFSSPVYFDSKTWLISTSKDDIISCRDSLLCVICMNSRQDVRNWRCWWLLLRCLGRIRVTRRTRTIIRRLLLTSLRTEAVNFIWSIVTVNPAITETCTVDTRPVRTSIRPAWTSSYITLTACLTKQCQPWRQKTNMVSQQYLPKKLQTRAFLCMSLDTVQK